MVSALRTEGAPLRSSTWRRVVPLAVLVMIGVLLGLGATRALRDLEAMQTDVHLMNARLATLEAMNRKLDRLTAMSSSLEAVQRRLDVTIGQLQRTNGLLVTTNGKLDMANGKLDSTKTSITNMSRTLLTMERELRSVGAMRADIHTMVHKIGGSFLFKGVK